MQCKLSKAFLTDKDTTAFLLKLCVFVIKLQLDDGFKKETEQNGRHYKNRGSNLDTGRANWHNDNAVGM